MANEENLKPVQSKEEARARGRKGGIASGKARRERKAMREQMEMLLSLPNTNSKVKQAAHAMGIKNKDVDNQMALVISIFNQAMRGNTNAANIVREIIGERVQNINLNANIDEKVKELDAMLEEL